ncbi:uncharacterized protein LOC108160833 [Drosophila miranda]|uniref:uncharacterized protein LOC108160833 n=1 Tax=Drosophila miranda TaxID=7229 RepID=UPI0007E60CF5|nr:uncharacterized protein LOC108160833 [Drosophila miranda]
MEVKMGKELVIKMTQKNKETQTTNMKLGPINWYPQVAVYPTVGPRYTGQPLGPIQAFMPRQSSSACQFYMHREQELYRRACRLKGIRMGCWQLRDRFLPGPSYNEELQPPYRYTLEEMKSLNPYRLVNYEN